ncbi:hypothetical protein Q8A67_015651 [Cirrhinus molitorella]|uniref:Uncharacterized protein n=1 Tax=Cirrhinus molitorella TaxID=172907 RepID=A0AA88PF50_9TELE|nr:hypothetical protein Q8A67_015651 [Cirrhinus molitorella]
MASEVVSVPTGDVEIDVNSKDTDLSVLVIVVEESDNIPLVLTKESFSDISCSAVVVGRVVIIKDVGISTGMLTSRRRTVFAQSVFSVTE